MTRRSGLGRGLDALLPPEPPAEDTGLAEAGPPSTLSVDDIAPNPRQPRRSFDDHALAELATSIAELGILQPLLVRASGDGRWELIAGERRLRAARQAGLEEVPVIVVDTDDRGALERALVENIHRADLNPIEEAAALQQLLDDGGLTHEELSRRLGRSRTAITNTLRLLDLSLPLKRMLAEGRLSQGHARALLPLNHSPFQGRLAQRVSEEGISVRAAEDLVRRYLEMSGAESPSRPGPSARPRPAALTEAQSRLRDHLQARVRVDLGARKGKIVVEFSSLDDLDRIVGLMLGDTPGGATVVLPP
jgi:ParB family transcriptional regulator, chromosome partitioning protein